MLISDGTVELFNPFHDKLGRFARKKGVSGGVSGWLNKPIATVKGKTITRKHAIAAAGATAAAAVAAGAVVYVTKSGDPKIAGHGGLMVWHRGDSPDFARMKEFEQGLEEDASYVNKTLDKFDPRRDDAYEDRATILYNHPDEFVKATGARRATACVDDEVNTHMSPSALLRDAQSRVGVLFHEELHTRTRIGKRGKLTKGNSGYNKRTGWREESLTETLTRIIHPGKYNGYDRETNALNSMVKRFTGNRPDAGFHMIDRMHKHNADDESFESYTSGRSFERDLAPYIKKRGSDWVGFARRISRGRYVLDKEKPLTDDELDGWIASMRKYYYTELSDYDGVDIHLEEQISVEESEKETIKEYGTIYIPADQIRKRLERDQK
jgi:hypothetical protein